MAKMKRNIGDLVSGKIGNVVFVQMKNGSYVRAAPVRKKANWTEPQLFQRQRMSKMGVLWKLMAAAKMKGIWSKAAVGMNGYAWFVKNNMETLSLDGQLMDPGMLIVSDGKLKPLHMLKAEQEDPLSEVIKISWQNDPYLNKEMLNDTLYALTLAGDRLSELKTLDIKRGDLSGTFNLPLPAAPVEDGPKTLYIFLRSDQGLYSKSEGFEIKT